MIEAVVPKSLSVFYKGGREEKGNGKGKGEGGRRGWEEAK